MKHAILGASLTTLAAIPLAAHPGHGSAAANNGPSKIVVVIAHPDDELSFAPALAGLTRAGHEVTLVYATDGDQGPGVSGMERGKELGRVRREEASCAADALGAKAIRSLDLGDGTLGIEARKEGSSAKRLYQKLFGALIQAETVITFGPEGGYGHSDHRIVGAVVTQYVQSLPAEIRPTLLYPAIIHKPLPEVLEKQGWTTTAPDLATVNYRYDDTDLAAANAAAQCHKTQFDEATRAIIVPGFDAEVWKGEVHFRKAF